MEATASLATNMYQRQLFHTSEWRNRSRKAVVVKVELLQLREAREAFRDRATERYIAINDELIQAIQQPKALN